MDRPSDRFLHLADVGDLASARVCVALLGSEGIEARVHGETLGPYPVTVGRMAVTQIWVPESRLDRACEVLLEAEIEHALAAEVRGGAVVDREALPMKVLALLVVIVLVTAIVRAVVGVF